MRRRGPWAAGDSPRRVLVRGRRRTAAARDRRSRRRSRRRLGRRKTEAALQTWSLAAGIWAARGDHRTRGRDRTRRIRGLRRICRAGGCRGARVWIGRRIRRFRWAVPCDRIRNRRDRDRQTQSRAVPSFRRCPAGVALWVRAGVGKAIGRDRRRRGRSRSRRPAGLVRRIGADLVNHRGRRPDRRAVRLRLVSRSRRRSPRRVRRPCRRRVCRIRSSRAGTRMLFHVGRLGGSARVAVWGVTRRRR